METFQRDAALKAFHDGRPAQAVDRVYFPDAFAEYSVMALSTS